MLRGSPRNTLVGCMLGVSLLGLGWWWWTRREPPQLPDDSAVFKTVNALLTAVCSRDDQAVAACQRRLVAYRRAQRLPDGAARCLDRIIQRTQHGDWDTAAQELYQFMYGQRRQARPAPRPGSAMSGSGV